MLGTYISRLDPSFPASWEASSIPGGQYFIVQFPRSRYDHVQIHNNFLTAPLPDLNGLRNMLGRLAGPGSFGRLLGRVYYVGQSANQTIGQTL